MFQTKMFFDNGKVEEDINQWLQEHPEVESVSIIRTPMYDMYQNQAPTVCNQWSDTILVYKIPDVVTSAEPTKLDFKEMEANVSTHIMRAEVPGGWLVLSSEEVWTTDPDHHLHGNGFEWRSGACFVPDPNHTWR